MNYFPFIYDHRHIHYGPFHFDIKNDKVWVPPSGHFFPMAGVARQRGCQRGRNAEFHSAMEKREEKSGP